MFPFIYEFHWTPVHVVFLGIFFSVVIVMFTTLSLALLRAYQAFRRQQCETIQWEAEFEDLPVTARMCRHQITGEIAQRTCNHEVRMPLLYGPPDFSFTARTCAGHGGHR